MAEKSILIIHPYDKTTFFLNDLKNHLVQIFRDDIIVFDIGTNDESHIECIKVINSHPENGLIIFLGHGRSDAIAGSKGDWFTPDAEWEELAKHPDLFYYKETFIGKNNSNILKGKKVFCLSCRSREKISEYLAENEVTTFLGFGDIPTSFGEFNEHVTPAAVNAMQRELNYIIKTSLTLCLSKGLTFEELLNYIHFITNQRISDILINEKHFEERHLLVDNLYLLKKEAMIIGNKRLRLIE